jgi:hypothetical protein
LLRTCCSNSLNSFNTKGYIRRSYISANRYVHCTILCTAMCYMKLKEIFPKLIVQNYSHGTKTVHRAKNKPLCHRNRRFIKIFAPQSSNQIKNMRDYIYTFGFFIMERVLTQFLHLTLYRRVRKIAKSDY